MRVLPVVLCALVGMVGIESGDNGVQRKEFAVTIDAPTEHRYPTKIIRRRHQLPHMEVHVAAVIYSEPLALRSFQNDVCPLRDRQSLLLTD